MHTCDEFAWRQGQGQSQAECKFIVGEGGLLHVGGGQYSLSMEEWEVQPKLEVEKKQGTNEA